MLPPNISVLSDFMNVNQSHLTSVSISVHVRQTTPSQPYSLPAEVKCTDWCILYCVSLYVINCKRTSGCEGRQKCPCYFLFRSCSLFMLLCFYLLVPTLCNLQNMQIKGSGDTEHAKHSSPETFRRTNAAKGL